MIRFTRLFTTGSTVCCSSEGRSLDNVCRTWQVKDRWMSNLIVLHIFALLHVSLSGDVLESWSQWGMCESSLIDDHVLNMQVCVCLCGRTAGNNKLQRKPHWAYVALIQQVNNITQIFITTLILMKASVFTVWTSCLWWHWTDIMVLPTRKKNPK